MHKEARDGILFFRDNFIEGKDNLTIMELGSMDWNGEIRSYFKNNNYIGCDLEIGDNVDVVLERPYEWDMFHDNFFDVVLSANTFEHIQYPWLTIKEVARVLKPEGLFCISVPQDCPEHKSPLDCYRYYPDGLRALATWAGLETIEVYRTLGEKWTDCMIVGRKNAT